MRKHYNNHAFYLILNTMDTEEIIVKCLNCGKEYTGKYCPNCGQKAKTKRLKFWEIVADLNNFVIGGDNKFLNTLHGLCRRPGHMVREYIQGHRSQYYNPLQMLIWILSIYAVLSFVIGSDPFEITTAQEEIVPKGDSPWQIWLAYLDKVYGYIKHNKLYYTLACAFMAIGPYRFSFRKYKISRPDGAELALNSTEQFYAFLYQSCMEMAFATLLLPFCLIKGAEGILEDINNFADILFTLILYKQLYRIGWWKNIKRNLVAAILFILFVCLFATLAFTLVLGTYYLIYGFDEFITK